MRACELRNSPLGLLSDRTTSFSNRDGVCTAGEVEPNSRLHGSSLIGSAAAPRHGAGGSAVIAPATAMPCPSRARRLIRPLPATGSYEGARPRRLHLLIISSLMSGAICALLIGISCCTP